MTKDEINMVCDLASIAVEHGIGLGQESLGWTCERDDAEREYRYRLIEQARKILEQVA